LTIRKERREVLLFRDTGTGTSMSMSTNMLTGIKMMIVAITRVPPMSIELISKQQWVTPMGMAMNMQGAAMTRTKKMTRQSVFDMRTDHRLRRVRSKSIF
jgi:hypothetical protein